MGGHVHCIASLYEAGADLNHADHNGITALLAVSLRGLTQVVRVLALDMQANPNKVRRGTGVSPLFLAAEHGHAATQSVLLAAGADPNIARFDGVSPLFVAAMKGKVEIVQHLLDAGADANRPRTKDGTVSKKLLWVRKRKSLQLYNNDFDARLVVLSLPHYRPPPTHTHTPLHHLNTRRPSTPRRNMDTKAPSAYSLGTRTRIAPTTTAQRRCILQPRRECCVRASAFAPARSCTVAPTWILREITGAAKLHCSRHPGTATWASCVSCFTSVQT